MTRRPYVDPWISEQIGLGRVIPIPVREDLVVRVFGVPPDLTEVEAAKIAAVIKAFASSPSPSVAMEGE